MVGAQSLLEGVPQQAVRDVERLKPSCHALSYETVRVIRSTSALDPQRLNIDRVEHGPLQLVEFINFLCSDTTKVEGDMAQLWALLLVA